MASSGKLKPITGKEVKPNFLFPVITNPDLMFPPAVIKDPETGKETEIGRIGYDEGKSTADIWKDIQEYFSQIQQKMEDAIGGVVDIKNLISNTINAAGDFISAFVPLNASAVSNMNKYILEVTKNLGAKIISNNALLEKLSIAYSRGSSNLTAELSSMISGDARNQSLRKRLQALDDKYTKASKDIASANQKAQADIDRLNMAQQVASTGRTSSLKQADELITGQQGRGAVEQLLSNLGSGEYYGEGKHEAQLTPSDPSAETQELVKGGFGE